MSYRLHVDQNSLDNSILERGTYFRFQSASELDHAIEAFKAKYDVKVLFKCPSDLDLRRGLPVKASGGILGRLKAALVRVSHAVEAWFNKLLGRDVTLSLNLATSRDTCKRTDTGAMGIHNRPLPDPPSVWAENPLYERTTRSISISTSISDLASEKDSDEVFAGETAGDGFDWGTEKHKSLAEDDESQGLSWDDDESQDLLWDDDDLRAQVRAQGEGGVEDKDEFNKLILNYEFNEWIHGDEGLNLLGLLDFTPMEQADAGPEVTNQQADEADEADEADGSEPTLREIMKWMQKA